jgi:integrase
LRIDATVNELLDRHLALLQCSEHTRQSHEWLAAKHIRPFLGRMRLLAVTPERLDGLYAEVLRCREHCARKHTAGHVCRPLHPSTVRKIHCVLSAAFRRAVRWGWIDRSPTGEATAPAQPHPEPRPPTPTEAARILTEAWQDPDLGPLVWVAMATGARCGELCALRWRHIDTARGLVVIRSAIAQAGSQVWEKDTKLHQRRHIALDPITIAVLTDYRELRRCRAAALGVELSAEGFVFSPRADARTCRSPQALTCQYHRLVAGLGVATTVHKLRHYSATELIRAGVDVRTVAGRLGHADGGTTSRITPPGSGKLTNAPAASSCGTSRSPARHQTWWPRRPAGSDPWPRTRSSSPNSAPQSMPACCRPAPPCRPSSNSAPAITWPRAPRTAPSPSSPKSNWSRSVAAGAPSSIPWAAATVAINPCPLMPVVFRNVGMRRWHVAWFVAWTGWLTMRQPATIEGGDDVHGARDKP